PAYGALDYIAGSVKTPTLMQYCTVAPGTLLDPTNVADYGGGLVNPAVSDLYLADAWAVAPSAEKGASGAGNAPLDPVPDGQTACLISLTITKSSTNNPAGQLVARVYTSADSQAWPH